MPQNIQLIAGAILVIGGSIKAWTHAVAISTLAVPGWLAGKFVLRLDMPLLHRVHCWGCYAAVVGFGLLTSVLVQAARRQRRVAAI